MNSAATPAPGLLPLAGGILRSEARKLHTVRMTLRPARVAVVFDGGEGWQYWARLAIYAVSQVRGGAGFILVPHSDGEVAPSLLRAAAAVTLIT